MHSHTHPPAPPHYFFKIYFYVFECFAYLYVCVFPLCVLGVWRTERASDVQELKLHSCDATARVISALTADHFSSSHLQKYKNKNPYNNKTRSSAFNAVSPT